MTPLVSSNPAVKAQLLLQQPWDRPCLLGAAVCMLAPQAIVELCFFSPYLQRAVGGMCHQVAISSCYK